MKLKKKLPPNRSYEQVKNHYLVERALAAKLKESTREERRALFLFAQPGAPSAGGKD